MEVNLIINPTRTDRCTECRSCELACSFHHAGCFDPAKSSIQVNIDNNTGDISINFDSTCDGCPNEEEPLCSLFCPRDVFAHKVKNSNQET